MKVKVAAVILLSALLLSACEETELTEEQKQQQTYDALFREERFISPYKKWTTADGYLVIDKRTNVEYWYIPYSITGDSHGQGGSMTLLVDQDGKPLVWNGE